MQGSRGNERGTLSRVGGISIYHSGSPGALLARGLIQEAETGFSSVVEFSDPQTAKSSRLDGAGLRIGKVAGEQLTQAAVARNIGDAPTVLTGRISYTTSAGNGGEVSLPGIRLGAGEVKELKLPEAVEEVNLKKVAAAGLQFEYSGQPGSVVMSALSVSSSGNQVFRVPLVDAKAQSSSTGKYPWMIDESASTFVYIKNATDHPQRYQLEVDYQGGAYALGIKTITAGQTMVLDIRKLRDNQTPDESGHPIPLDATHGQVYWTVDGREDLTLIGRAEQVDVTRGLSMTSACGTCCPASFFDGFCDPSSVIGFPGDTSQFTAKQRKQDCNGNILSAVTVLSPTWSSTNTTVATVDANGLATAQGAGSTNINATWDITYIDFLPGGCNFDPDNCTGGHCFHRDNTFTASATCDVLCAVPTNFHQVGSGTDNGGVLHFQYAWDSSTGRLSDLSQCTVGEIVTYPSGNPYTWPNPPFNQSSNNPTVIDAAGTSGGFGDDHLGPISFVKPYSPTSFFATQFYRYRCPCSSGGTYVNLSGSISIVRSVGQNSGGTTWNYTVTKSGSSATINPLP